MIELPLVFLGGLLGSSHCLGMCGGFALSIGGQAPSFGRNLARQLVYSGGRVFTYAFLGAGAGYLGRRVALELETIVAAQAWLAIGAGVLLVLAGLRAAGWAGWWPRLAWRSKTPRPAPAPCLSRSALATFLRSPDLGGVFFAGLLTGFLPCGLVYAFLALAASCQSVLLGAASMAVFGLGTVPLMVLAGGGGSLLSLSTRRWAMQAAAWCVVVSGLISIARGASFLDYAAGSPTSACPFCP